MSILFADNFQGYGTNSALLLNGLWGTMTMPIQADPDPNATGNVLRTTNLQNTGRRPFAKGALTVFGCACRIWLDTLPTSHGAMIRALDAANNLQCAMAITPTGIIEIWYQNPDHGGAILAATPTPVVTANAWHHYEFKVTTAADNSGTAEVRVDGVTVLTVTGVMTGSAYQLGLGSNNDYNGSTFVYGYYKDLVVWDATGGHNNDFLGQVSVVSMLPDSDVSLGWTPSTGTTGFNLLNQSPPVDGSDFITAPFPPPNPSTFTLSDLPLNVTTVRALITQVRANKSDGGDGDIQVGLISSATEIDGSNRPITTAFTYYEDVFEIDPHTNSPWSPASADAAEIKINRTS